MDLSFELEEIRVGDIANVQTGPFGSQLHKGDYVQYGTPIITVEHLGDNKILHNDTPFVSDEDAQRLSKYSLKEGDIVFSRVGSVDRRAYVSKKEEGWLFSGRCLRLRVNNTKKIDSRYLSYYFGLERFKEYVRSIAVGATMPSLNTKIMSDLKFKAPKLTVQMKISNILSSIDSKIELNHAINKNLEDMAQALFKRWFVDFEFPNENGEPYKSSGGAFEDSELGFIPNEWEIRKIGDVLALEYGKALKKSERMNGAIPVYGSNGRVGYHNTHLVKGPGIVVGRKGNPGVVKFVNTDFYPIDTTFYVVSRVSNFFSLNYIYHTLSRQNLKSLSADSAVPGLNRNIVYMSNMLIPPRELLDEFESRGQSFRDLISEKEVENDVLSQIRDTLLPKLMSGEIRVPVEQVYEEVHTGL